MADDGYFDKQARPEIRAALDRLKGEIEPAIFLRTVAYVMGEIIAEEAAGDMNKQTKLSLNVVSWTANGMNDVNKKRRG